MIKRIKYYDDEDQQEYICEVNIKWWNDTYGEDADGNRGIAVIDYDYGLEAVYVNDKPIQLDSEVLEDAIHEYLDEEISAEIGDWAREEKNKFYYEE